LIVPGVSWIGPAYAPPADSLSELEHPLSSSAPAAIAITDFRTRVIFTRVPFCRSFATSRQNFQRVPQLLAS